MLTNTTFVPSALIPPASESPFAAVPSVARLTSVVVFVTVSRTKTLK